MGALKKTKPAWLIWLKIYFIYTVQKLPMVRKAEARFIEML